MHTSSAANYTPVPPETASALAEAPSIPAASVCISTGTGWNPLEPHLIRSIADIRPISYYSSQPINFVVEGLIAEATVTLLTGESGCGKTTLVSAICKAINLGVPFAGLATQQRPILYLDRENPVSLVRERFQRLSIEENEGFKVWGGMVSRRTPITFM
jgi:hypothetical protein